eukprot:129707_1
MGLCVCGLFDTTTEINKKQDQLDATTTPTTANDEIDEFIETIRESTNDHSFIALFICWIKSEQYDWDSILNDIDCTIAGGFIALFISWIKSEQYDWDSILNDIDCTIAG